MTLRLIKFFWLLPEPDRVVLWSFSTVCLLDSSSFRFAIPRLKTDSLFESDPVIIRKNMIEPDPRILFE